VVRDARSIGGAALIDLGLPIGTTVSAIRCQTEAVVDDILLETEPQGFIFIQCKRRTQLSRLTKSALGKAIDQFVHQWIICEDRVDNLPWARPLDPAYDRLVLATSGGSSASVVDVLARLLNRVRDAGGTKSIEDSAISGEERRVAANVTHLMQQSFRAHRHREPSTEEVSRIQRGIWIQVLDVEEGERDARDAQDNLSGVVLASPDQALPAWNTLTQISARLAAERSGKTLPALRTELRVKGIALHSPPSYEADITNLRNWSRAKLVQDSVYTRLSARNPATTIVRACFQPYARLRKLRHSS
jgi:hypothetical protein